MAFKKTIPNLDSFISGAEQEPFKAAVTKPELEPVINKDDVVVDDVNKGDVVKSTLKKENTATNVKQENSNATEDDKHDSAMNKVIFLQTDADFNELRNYAFNKRTTKTRIIRIALREYLDRNP